MLLRKVLVLLNGKKTFTNSKNVLHLIKRTFTNELIDVNDNEVLELHSPILAGTSRILVTGSGRVTV